ncbi:FAD-binding protein [Rhodococcus sp. HNM0569]|uniref:FAD-binding protein n=1 Tax=Rhodococcus sp. HNM0569 TaxID=2716340 RepID=UPI00146D9423|nr:FAD-binding protein [Rhodococcus sp. HNM0569]
MAEIVTDVVVVGFGGAGAATALEARENGADVVVLEARTGGGATTISGGIYYAGGGTSIQRDAGIADTPAQMLDYLTFEVGESVAPETLRRFVDQSTDNLEWIMGHGVPFDASVCPYKTSFPTNDYYLYFSGSEASGAARAVTPPVQRGHRAKGRGASGKMIFEPLAAATRRSGADVLLQTWVTDLVVEEGRVVGVRARTLRDAPARVRALHARLAKLSSKPGVYAPQLRAALEYAIRRLERRHGTDLVVRARSGVVLTTGGFVSSRELMAEHAPEFTGGIPLGTALDDGKGITMATELGAGTAHMNSVSAWRFISPPSGFLSGLIVDRAGNRIVDESRYGAAVGDALVRKAGRHGWLLVDAPLDAESRALLPKQSLWFQRIQATGLLRTAVRGDTIEDVARRAGIDPDGLRRTVDATNDAIRDGKPDEMDKYDDFRRVLETGPFTLYDVGVKPNPMNPCPMLTLGGLTVDETSGAVLRTDGSTIDGLYAAGRAAAGVCATSYVSGLSIADCIFAGRRAGRSAALAPA